MSLTSSSVSVIIATRNRPALLVNTVRAVAQGSLLPTELIIVDSSDDPSSENNIVKEHWPFPLQYVRTEIRSAARQRNHGAELAIGHYLVFLDDDLSFDCTFLSELIRPFSEGADPSLLGVGATNVSCTFADPSFLNRCLLSLFVGKCEGDWSGRLLGPAINFAPRDIPGGLTQVDWLASVAVVYPRDVFLKCRFEESFEGYSFAEDVHLSARIARRGRLVVSGTARLVHLDGANQDTRNWRSIGSQAIKNRRLIMTDILDRRSAADYFRFYAYELLYNTLAVALQRPLRWVHFRRSVLLLAGKLEESLMRATRRDTLATTPTHRE